MKKNKILASVFLSLAALTNVFIIVNACFDELNITNAKLIKSIHQEYIDAGRDVILTNTFGANIFKLEKFGLSDKVYDINFQGAKIQLYFWSLTTNRLVLQRIFIHP